jgi:hypothetical protein
MLRSVKNFFIYAALCCFTFGAAEFCAAASRKAVVFDPIVVDSGDGIGHPVRGETTEFDKMVLDACGDWGNKVSLERIISLFDRAPADVKRNIYNDLGGSVDGGKPVGESEFFRDLAELLHRREGFEHIFCGEPERRQKSLKLGGLHFFARYQELQDKGLIGLDPIQCSDVQLDGPVNYVFGMQFLYEGLVGKKCPQSYVNNMHADHMITSLVKAYKLSLSTDQPRCLYHENVGGQSLYFVFFRDKVVGGPVTLYALTENAVLQSCGPPEKRHCRTCGQKAEAYS